jgi:hypothetical protein
MRAVGKIQAEDVGAGGYQCVDGDVGVAGWTDGRDDFCVPHLSLVPCSSFLVLE